MPGKLPGVADFASGATISIVPRKLYLSPIGPFGFRYALKRLPGKRKHEDVLHASISVEGNSASTLIILLIGASIAVCHTCFQCHLQGRVETTSPHVVEISYINQRLICYRKPDSSVLISKLIRAQLHPHSLQQIFSSSSTA